MIQRTFIPGDEWLYYKLYCGARTADAILTEALHPLTELLLKEERISQWFFIRYTDPEFHLRIRFYMKDTSYSGKVMSAMQKALQPYVEEDMVYDVQIATYQREIERYGAETIALSESLFCHESVMLVPAIAVIADEKLYFLFILKVIDRLLDDFEYTLGEKSRLVSENALAYKKEFQADRRLQKQLDKKYRGLDEELIAFLEAFPPDKEYEVLVQLLEEKARKNAEIIQNILHIKKNKPGAPELNSLLGSYIHMLVNRAFRSRQRFYELVCYDFLKRYYSFRLNHP